MKSFLFSTFFLFSIYLVNAQVGIGTTSPDTSSMLDITSANSGLLIPRIGLLSSTDTVTIASPVTSLLVYNTGAGGLTPAGYYYWNGTTWITLAGSGGTDWTLTGNSGTTAGTNFIGTADAVDLRIKTGGTDRLNISNTNGQLQSYSSGSATAPSYSFTPDTNTGVYSSGADNLNITTGGTERVRVDNTGKVGINATPTSTLDIAAVNTTGTTTNVDGILIPRVDRQRAQSMTGTPTGTLVYVNSILTGTAAGTTVNVTAIGFYFYDGSVWTPLVTGTLTNDWTILGNTNIVDGTNFIGTGLLTNVDVAFRRNGLAAGKIGATSTSFGVGALTSGAATNSTAFGTNALTANTGNNNTAIGSSATIITPLVAVLASALAANTTGANNTAVGAGSLAANVTGANNTAVGVGSLAANTATGNTAVGSSALTTNSSGTGNSALGTNALRLNTTGTNNTAIGTSSSTLTPLAAALGANTTASNITAVGASALAANTTGSGNSALGSNALRANTTGTNNTAIGTSASTGTPLFAALAANTTGGNNTAVGAGALALNTVTSGNTAIGSQALAANFNGFAGAAENNTAIGSSALLANTTGRLNVALGASAGSAITTGSSNIMIGANTVAPSATGSSQLNIGNTIFGDMTGVPLTLGVNTTRTIGINVLSPQGALDITSSTEGLLIPRVALADTATVTVLTGTTSEIVYNTFTSAIGPNQVTPGFYYLSTNTGPWVRFNTGTISGWSTTGNSGLTAGTNFMGTTDNVDVSFKRSNTAAGFIGANSTAFGVSSLAANSGTNNTAFGTGALAANDTPGDNTAIGYNALAVNTLNSGAGNLNTAVGSGALDSLNGGARNTAVGANALTGVNDNASLDNVAVGQNALRGTGTITQSVAIGSGALLNSGSATTRSTAVGFNAGNNVSLSIDSVFIGTNALGTGATATNQIAIGSGATASGDNAVRLGNTAITTINGQVNFTATSDRRWKDNIKDSGLGLEFIKTIRPVSYFRKNDKNKKTEYGFIAQELETAFENAGDSNNAVVSKDAEGMYGVRYSDFISISVKAIQEQQEEIEALKKANAELMKTNQAILKRLEALEKK